MGALAHAILAAMASQHAEGGGADDGGVDGAAAPGDGSRLARARSALCLPLGRRGLQSAERVAKDEAKRLETDMRAFGNSALRLSEEAAKASRSSHEGR